MRRPDRDKVDMLALLRDAVDHLDQGFSLFSGDLRLIAWNRRYRELLDFPESLCQTGTPLEAFFRYNAERGDYGPGDIETQVAERLALAQRRESHHFERKRPDGTVLDICGFPLADGGFVTTYADVTARVRAQHALSEANTLLEQKVTERTAALAEREQMLKATLESMEQGITMIDGDLKLMVCNQRTRDLLDLPREITQPGDSLEAIFRFNAERGEYGPGDIDSQVRERVAACHRFESHRLVRTRPDGTVLEIIGQPLPDRRFVSTYKDITLQERAKQELRLAAYAFETQEGMMITDADGVIVRANDAMTRLTDYAPIELIGQTPEFLQAPRHGNGLYADIWDGLRTAGRWQGKVWYRRRDGGDYPQWMTVTAVTEQPGQLRHGIWTCLDLTELNQQQSVIERSALEERALTVLANLALEPLPMETFLDQALRELLDAVPWLSLLPQGGLFLNEQRGRGRVLRLVASHGMAAPLLTLCDSVPFGRCLCGAAAASETLLHVDCVDERHETGFEGMPPHGHYNVPIVTKGRVLGVMVLYLPEGYVAEESDKRFLNRVADMLGLGILRRYAEEEALHLAFHEPLTDLPNRRLLLDRVQQASSAARRQGFTGALLQIDLDHFNNLNDALGPDPCDQILRRIGGRLTVTIREEDTVAHLGADEFAVLLPKLSRDAQSAGIEAGAVAEKIRRAVAAPLMMKAQHHQLTCSIGITLFPEDHDKAPELLRNAGTAINFAKQAGRDTVRFFQGTMQATAEKRIQVVTELRTALAEGQLELYYHPQVDGTGQVVGAEALVRWRHPERGVIGPGEFIPQAEESGLIAPLGDRVLREACRQLRTWMDDGTAATLRHLSVNLSAAQFSQPQLVDQLRDILAESGADPHRLTLEITETVVVENITKVVETMRAIRALGVSFAIDDFGTGYSSLAYLKALPINALKIDRSFVQDIPDDPNDAAIVDTIIAMARHLTLHVVAEGVETIEQLDFLRQHGCQIFQGFHFARPLPAAEFATYVARMRDTMPGPANPEDPER